METITTNAHHENLIENLTEGMVYVSPSMHVLVFNQAAESMTEISRRQAVGVKIDNVFKKNSWLCGLFKKTLEEEKVFSDYEGTLLRTISHPIAIGVSTIRVIAPDGAVAGVAVLLKELSALKSIEGETLRKERLMLLGTFAANLAHEVRNPLAGIRGAAQLLSRKLESNGNNTKLTEYTDVIIEASDRLNSVVMELLNFTKPKKLKKTELNIHRVLDGVIALVEKEGETAPVNKHYDPSLPCVKGSANQLTQVFLNLIKNAKQAVRKNKGQVRVTTRMVTEFHIVNKSAGGTGDAKFVEIEIMDNGCGIKPEHREKIFTPFFTTRQGGSGLGLALSYTIIKEHSGFITIDSEDEEPGNGTWVHVYLPVAT